MTEKQKRVIENFYLVVSKEFLAQMTFQDNPANGCCDIYIANDFGGRRKVFEIREGGRIHNGLQDISLKSALDHLHLHQIDWERCNPEMVREAEWHSPFDESEVLVLQYGGLTAGIYPRLDAFHCNWWVKNSKDTQLIYEASPTVNQSKEAAAYFIITYLKNNQP